MKLLPSEQRLLDYPERFAQEALGHASPAIHRAYAKSVRVELPPLEEYEREKSKVVCAAKGGLKQSWARRWLRFGK